MSGITEKKSLRDLIGTLIKTQKMVLVAVLILVASTTVIELLPLIGVLSALLLIYRLSWFMRDK